MNKDYKIDRQVIIEIDEKYYRPAEVDTLLGDYKKAKEVLGWESKVKFGELVKIMMMNDIKNIYKNNEKEN